MALEPALTAQTSLLTVCCEMSMKTPGKAIMIQGTGSDVGKSVIVAGLCRIAKRRGLTVAPFKPQNMSNNAAACVGGGEIGRAQALQARAAGLELHVDFNPVLLKPQSDCTSQVIVQGHPLSTLDAADYMKRRDGFLPYVMESFERLTRQYDLIIVEGAGSPAEINLRHRDIANMGFARRAGVPVCLVGDIERGGVIAALVGTKNIIDPDDAKMIVGFAVNKFRGDMSLFDDGVIAIETRTGWPCFGVIPWIHATAKLPAEDAVALTRPDRGSQAKIRIAAPMLSRIANFDDADPLRLEPEVDFGWVRPGQAIPRDIDVIMLFGTKSTIGDLDFLRAQGWDHDIISHARHGGRVTGLCGGYQIMGQRITDARGVEGEAGTRAGLGLLNIETTMTTEKIVRPVDGQCAVSDQVFAGYEIHIGETTGADCVRPMLHLPEGPDGARSPDGRIEGTYVHGLFANNNFRAAWLSRVKSGVATGYDYDASVETALEDLADGLEMALDIDAIFAAARRPGWQAD